MSVRAIYEHKAKTVIKNAIKFDLACQSVLISDELDLDEAPKNHPWLLTEVSFSLPYFDFPTETCLQARRTCQAAWEVGSYLRERHLRGCIRLDP